MLTLVIIGIIAVITIPTVVNRTNGMQYKSAFKKAVASIAYAIDKNWAFTNLSVSDYDTEQDLYDNIFSQHLHIFDTPDSFTTDDYSGVVFRTNDGVIYCLQNFHSDKSESPDSVCDINNNNPCVSGDAANLFIDVNGYKAPNKMIETADKPSDVYQAQIYSRLVVPYGQASYEVMFK